MKRKLLSLAVASVMALSVLTAPAAVSAADDTTYLGFGGIGNFREGPGTDADGTPVYSFNYTFAAVLFDSAGKIVDDRVDILEIATPNYDGDSMPHFSGWPGSEGYPSYDPATKTILPAQKVTEDSAAAEIAGWKTKVERGDSYGMNPQNEWYKQMDFYQNWFKGQTVAQIKDWVSKYTTSAFRPIKADTTKADDQVKLAQYTDAEKAQLADVVSGATMSLDDVHGLILDALQKAYDNRVAVKSADIASLGLASAKNFRVGPHKDSNGNQTYSFNVVTGAAALDSKGKIAACVGDILEIASPNSEGKAPKFPGWPGREVYLSGDANAKISVDDTKTAVYGWKTKRERGDTYGMSATNDWHKQMDFYQNWMIGQDASGLQAWFDKYTTSAGRPIKADTTDAGDQAKFAGFTDAEKAQLSDVVSGATMSLNDAHGNILGAVISAVNTATPVTAPPAAPPPPEVTTPPVTTTPPAVTPPPETTTPPAVTAPPEATTPPAVTTPPPAAPTVYTVVKGDCLSKIAVRYKTTVNAIMAVNKQIKDKDWIYVGDKITIPDGATVPQAVVTSAPAKPSAPAPAPKPAPAPAPKPAAPAPKPASPAPAPQTSTDANSSATS